MINYLLFKATHPTIVEVTILTRQLR